MKGKSPGNIMDLVTIVITILAMTIVVMVYLQCTELMMKKLEVSQISRKYILKMETEGFLSQENKNSMLSELKQIGLQNVDVTGTTQQPVMYGETIILHIKGVFTRNMLIKEDEVWNGGFSNKSIPVEEKRMSTAKN